MSSQSDPIRSPRRTGRYNEWADAMRLEAMLRTDIGSGRRSESENRTRRSLLYSTANNFQDDRCDALVETDDASSE